jgi:hypothetical protein
MVPAVEFPPGTPFTVQITAVFDAPVTVALNCCVLPSNTLELGDETITVTDCAGGVDELLPPQPAKRMGEADEQRSAMTAMACEQREERSGNDIGSARAALFSVMASPLSS